MSYRSRFPRWIIDGRWIVYAADEDAALQKFWAYYPTVLGPFSQVTEDVAKEIVREALYERVEVPIVYGPNQARS